MCSSIGSELEKVRAQISAAAREAGAEAKQDEAYPGWNPDPSSKVLQVCWMRRRLVLSDSLYPTFMLNPVLHPTPNLCFSFWIAWAAAGLYHPWDS